MSSLKFLVIMHHLSVICFVICITGAAIHFERIPVLFFYLIPLIMSTATFKSTDTEKKKEEEQHNG